MLYPWYNVRVQSLKQEHLNGEKMDKMEKQIEANQKEPLSKLKKQLFISLEFTFLNVSKIFQYIKLIHMYALW